MTSSRNSNSSIETAKLLKNIEKFYNPGKKNYWMILKIFASQKKSVLDTGFAPMMYEVVEWGNIKKPQHNQSASSDIDQQDLTTGSSIDNDAATDAKIRISNDGAKHELNNLIHKFRRATERTMKLFENIGIDVDVSLYKNSTKNQTIPITSRGTTSFDGIIDAKLQYFF